MGKLTKKDFETISKILKEHKASKNLILSFCNYLKVTNDKFKEDLFIKSCVTH